MSVTCDICGCEFEENKKIHIYHNPNRHVCPDCLEIHYIRCEECGDYVENREIKEVNDSYLCPYCSFDYVQCRDCGKWFNCEMEGSAIYNGEYVCEDCCSEYDTCGQCGELFPIDEMTLYDGYYYCKDCYDECFTLIKGYHDHDYNPTFFGDNHDNSVPYFGVELEVDYGVEECKEECANKIQCHLGENFVYFEEDGSLSRGFEIITQPATLEYHTSIMKLYEKAFNSAKNYNFKSHDTDTCGLHVHFNRSFFTENATEEQADLYLTRLLYLFEKFWNEMVIFSRRKISEIEDYACRYDESPKDTVKGFKRSKFYKNRYHAVNLTNTNTIEFRIFKGTLNPETFLATLQLCQKLVCVSKYAQSVEELQNLKFEDLLWTDELKNYWQRVAKRHVM